MDIKNTGIHFAKALAVSAVFSGLLLLLMAFLMYKGSLSGLMENILVIVIYLISCFVGGFLMGKQEGKRRFLWGAAFGGVYFLVLLLMSAAFGGGQPVELGGRALVAALCVLGGMAGGMVS